jgi:arsenate reductase
MTVTIFHNPACGTSRNTLAAIRQSDVEPTVVEYLKVGWTRAQLQDLLVRLRLTPRGILRTKGDLVAELGLADPSVSDDAILDAMVAHPILVERPIVISPKGAVLARPSERVFAILDNPPAEFVKEDGERVLPGNAPKA